MPKKPKSSKSTSRPRRRKRGRQRAGKIFFITFGFLVILFLGLYGAYYYKNHNGLEPVTKEVSGSHINSLADEADGIIAGALFDAGISQSDISFKKVHTREKNGVKWDYREISVDVPAGVSKDHVKTGIKRSFSGKPEFEEEFTSKGNLLTASVQTGGYRTHRIKFEFPAGKAPPGNIATAPGKVRDKESKKGEAVKESEPSSYREAAKDVKAPKGFKPKVAIIVDDLGENRGQIDRLLKLPEPVTFAVLPNLRYSTYAAESAGKNGWEVMLHLPMEPKESSGYTSVDAGEEVLVMGQPKKDILKKLDTLLSSVPNIQGVNNHMGSKFMENEELMTLVLKDIKDKNLFFVDSMTSSGSVGYETALKIGMKTGRRDIFLDERPKGSAYVKSQLVKLVEISMKKGYAIGICHPYQETIEALAEAMPGLSQEVEFTTVSRLLEGPKEISER